MTLQRTVPTDESVREQIRTQLDRSMVIEAGAGTGKTTLLIDRLIALLHKLDISEIVAITFTEKAAAELSERLYSELERECETLSDGHPLRRVLSRFDHANISTIHSFASSIIRERPIEVGIDPEFSQIEPEDEKLLLQKVLGEDLHKQDGKRDDGLMRFRALGGTFTYIVDLLKTLHDHRDLLELLSLQSQPVDYVDRAGLLINRFNDLFLFCLDHCDNATDSMHKKLSELINTLPQNEDQILNWLGDWSSFSGNKGAKTKWDSTDNLEQAKEELKGLVESVDTLVREVRTETLESIIRWLVRIIEQVEQVKSERGQLGYQDLMLRARSLLDQPQQLRHFQDRYKRILIDEFQDTDPLQVEIALMLCQQSPENKLPEPGKLCIVGDPKQSIYRFRRADPCIYKSATDSILQTGDKKVITQNFRSSAGIVNFVNRFFSSIWGESSDGQSEYIPIDPLTSRPELMPTPSVTILTPPAEWSEGDNKAYDVRFAEAEAIASSIRTAVESWQLLDGDRKRPADYGDIAILFPTTTDLDTYKNCLTDAGIPFQVEAGKKFYRSQIITDLYNCLKAIDNPLERLSVVGALRSALLGVSDVDLLRWLTASDETADYRIESPPLSEILDDSLTILRELHDLRKELIPDQLIENLLRRTEIIPVLSADRYGYSDVSTVNRIVDLARIYRTDYDTSLRGFLRWLSGRMESEDEKNSGEFDDSNRVRLITVHSAKGLEFPLLYLANLNSRPKLKVESVADRISGRFEMAVGAQGSSFETVGYQTVLPMEREIQKQEHVRLFYVALTRARDHLVLPLFYGRKPEGYSKWLSEFVNEYEDGEKDDLFKIVESQPYHLEKIKIDSILKIDPSLVWQQKQAWEQERHDRIKEVHGSLPKLQSPSSHEAGNYSDSNGSGNISLAGSVGRAVHSYMAICTINHPVDSDLLEYVSSEEGVESGEVIQHIENCINSDITKQISRAKRLWREVPVSVKSDGALVRGSIDLMWESDSGELFIADWKTGIFDPIRHENQIRQYAAAVTNSTGCSVKKGYLFFTKECRTVEVSCD